MDHPLQIGLKIKILPAYRHQHAQRIPAPDVGVLAGEVVSVIARLELHAARLAACVLGGVLLVLLAAAHRRGRTEQLGVLEHDSRRTAAPLRKSLQAATFASGNRVVGGVDMRDQLFDEGRLAVRLPGAKS